MKTGATQSQLNVAALSMAKDGAWSPGDSFGDHYELIEAAAQHLVPEDKRIIDLADLDRLVDRFAVSSDADVDLYHRMTALMRGDA